MTALVTTRIRCVGGLLALAGLLLGGCSSSALVKHCCYDGEEFVVRLNEVEFVATDGSVATFDDVYTDFEPEDRFVTTLFPFRKANIAEVTYDSLVLPLQLYDANKNGFLEEPEATVLYLREGALGMGHTVDHVAVGGKRAGAITTSRSDVGGLMRYLDTHKDSLKPETQEIFRDMVQVGQDIKLRGSEGADREPQKITP